MRLLLFASVLLVSGCAVDAASEADDDTVVGPFEQVDGADVLRAELRAEGTGDYAVSVRGGQYARTTNVLFYDVPTRDGRWLFPDSERTVLQTIELRDSSRVRAFLYVVAEEDSDGDDQFGAEDVQTIAVSDPAGRRLVRLAEGVTRFRQSVRLDDDTVLLLFDEGGAVRGVEVGLDALEVEAQVTMPSPPGTS